MTKDTYFKWVQASKEIKELVGETDQNEKDKRDRAERELDYYIRSKELSRF